jgi:hypothetical protein
MFDRLTQIENPQLLYALYPQVLELKESISLQVQYITWKQSAPLVR